MQELQKTDRNLDAAWKAFRVFLLGAKVAQHITKKGMGKKNGIPMGMHLRALIGPTISRRQ